MSEEYTGPRHNVFLAVPNAGAIMPCAHISVLHATAGRHLVSAEAGQFGDIEHNFNMMWCQCLNARASSGSTHFAMIHSDIGAEAGWLDVLLEEMDRLNADVMAAVVAIKDIRGLTTAGIRYPGVWGTRRFTVREVARLPDTFSIADTDEPEQILAINTGLWVARIPVGGWCEKFPGFTAKHLIKCINGQFVPWFDSEDWLFSDWAAEAGLRVYATQKVKCFHRGGCDYPNTGAWGIWETEQQRPDRPLGELLRSRPEPRITVETCNPVALDSLDHTQPLGTAQDNSVSYAFNKKLFELIPISRIRVLDLGCAGGGFVRSILEAGGFAIGLDGSDFSQKARRAEWATIPDYLFTTDVTEPFTIRNCTPDLLKFNVITAWEFWEHIPREKVGSVLDNLRRHVEPGTIMVSSISRHPEPHHLTIQAIEDWRGDFLSSGLLHDQVVEEHFGDNLVRGSHHPDAISRSLVMIFP